MIIDDHPLVRRALRQLLSQETDLEVLHEAHDAESALRLASTTPLDLILMDLSLKESSGTDLIGRGSTTRAIAEHLHVSVKTVETHRENRGVEFHGHAIDHGRRRLHGDRAALPCVPEWNERIQRALGAPRRHLALVPANPARSASIASFGSSSNTVV